MLQLHGRAGEDGNWCPVSAQHATALHEHLKKKHDFVKRLITDNTILVALKKLYIYS